MKLAALLTGKKIPATFAIKVLQGKKPVSVLQHGGQDGITFVKAASKCGRALELEAHASRCSAYTVVLTTGKLHFVLVVLKHA